MRGRYAPLLLLAAIACAQTNVDLSDGAIGSIPPGWEAFSLALKAGFTTQLENDACPGAFRPCVLFEAPLVPSNIPAEELSQDFSAAPYIGKKIRFSGWLSEVAWPGYVHLRMRVDYPKRRQFLDSDDPPVSSPFPQWRQVNGSVEAGAIRVMIWARFHPPGRAWVSNLQFGVAEDFKTEADDAAVRTLIRNFADRRNANDGAAAAALYSEDGVWFNKRGGHPAIGRQALTTLWGSVTGQVDRSIDSTEFPAPNVALIRVTARYAPTAIHYGEIFFATNRSGPWRIQVHEALP